MKQIVLPLASRFPAGHLKGGQLTGFPEKVIKGTKIHTFREDPGKWEYNMKQINSRNAELSIRRWIGRPYHTPQLEVKRLRKIGIQQVTMVREQRPEDRQNRFVAGDHRPQRLKD